MARRAAWLWATAAAAVLALVAITTGTGVLGGAGASSNAEAPDDSAAAARADAPPATAAPVGVAPTADGEDGGTRSAAAADLDPKDVVVVRGRLVIGETGAPPKNAVVTARTGKWDVDFAPTISALGGRAAYDELTRSGELEQRLWEIGEPTPQARSAARGDGTFELRVPKTMLRFAFHVECDDGAYAPVEWFQLGTPRLESEVVLGLLPAGPLDGVLVDVSGRPVSDGRVHYRPPRAWVVGRPWIDAPKRAKADREGRFRLRGIPAGSGGALYATAHGCAAVRQDVVLPAPSARAGLRVELPPEARLAGEVVDTDGRAVAGISVRVHAERASFPGLGYGVTRSGADGRFEARGLTKAKHRLTVYAPGRLQRGDARFVDVPLGEGAASPRIVLEAGQALSGRVVGGDGGGLAGARVTVAAGDAPGASQGRQRFLPQELISGPDGGFTARGLGEPPYTVSAAFDGLGAATKENVGGGPEPIEIVIRGSGFAGTVIDEGSDRPIAAFVIDVQRKADGETTYGFDGERAFANDSGAFDIGDLKPNAYRVKALSEGYVPSNAIEIDVVVGAIKRGVTFRLERGSPVRGKVLSFEGGKPIAGAQVDVERVTEETEEIRNFTYGARGAAETRFDGTYEIGGVAPGEVRVRAWHAERIEATSEKLRVIAGSPLEAPPISLAAGGAIEGIVVSSDGKPLPNAYVSVQPSRHEQFPGQKHIYKSARSDAAGRFRFGGVAAGAWVVHAQAQASSGGATSTLQLQAVAEVQEGAVATVQLSPPRGGCTVRGRVLRAGEPLAGVNLSISPQARPTGDRVEVVGSLSGNTSEDGSFVIEHVPPGEASISGWVPEFRGQGANAGIHLRVTIPDAPEHTLEIQVPAGGTVAGRVVRRSDGRPVEGLPIQLQSLSPHRDAGSVATNWANGRTDGEGGFLIRGLRPGKYLVTAGDQHNAQPMSSLAGLAPVRSGPIDVVEGATVSVEMSLDAASVVVVELTDESGAVAKGMSVHVGPPAGRGPESWSVIDNLWGQTDAQGIAKIAGVAPGRYVVTAQRPGACSAVSETFQVEAGRETRVQLRFQKGIPIRVHAAGPDSEELSIAWVSFHDERLLAVFFEHRQPGTKGNPAWANASLVPGKYTIGVGAEGYGNVSQEIVVTEDPSQSITVKLPKAPAKPAAK